MGSKPRILHVFNDYGPGKGSFHRARRIDPDRFDLFCLFYYEWAYTIEIDPTDEIDRLRKDDRVKLLNLGARARLAPIGWKRLYDVLNREHIDLIHTHHHLTGYLVRIFNPFTSSVPVVHSFGNRYQRFSLPARFLHRLTFPLVEQIVCVSEGVRASLTSSGARGLQRDPVVIHNGIDLEEFDRLFNGSSSESELNEGNVSDRFTIVSVGECSRQKDQRTMVEAIETVRRTYPEVHLLIVGTGPEKERLRNQVERLDLRDNVTLTGQVARERVFQLLKTADLFVMTSLWEGFCVALLEAMAARLPSVVTDIPEFREALVEEQSGVFVEPGDAEQLTKEINRLIADPSQRNQLGEAARKRVEKHFTMDKTARAYEDLYESLL